MDEPKLPNTKSAGNAANSSSPGQFMDFHTQTSKTPTDTAPPLPDSPVADETSDPLPLDDASAQEIQVTTEDPVIDSDETPVEPVETVSEEPVEAAPASTEESAEPAKPAAAGPDATEPSPLAIPAHASHKSGAPVLAIAAAVVVALALAGLVVFTFMNSKKDTVGSNNSIPASQTASKPLASPADVDATNKEIDASLSKIDDSKDFSAADLSDATLGL